MKPVLLYALHSGNLYGTERMALATMQGLRDTFDLVLMAPPGAALAEAQRLDIMAIPFRGLREFVVELARQLIGSRSIAFFATGVTHSLAFILLNSMWRRRFLHFHLVHGGTDERLSYGRKKWLNGRAVTLVAVSEFVRDRLEVHGVRAGQIRVIENFLPDEQIRSTTRRSKFASGGIRRVIVVSRVDPIKRVDLLLDLLDQQPRWRELSYDVYGTGWDLDVLRDRAAKHHPMVRFHGFSDRIADAMTQADLMLHLCPEEPFGLAILEAMAAGVPVLVPDQGGASSLVEPGVSGFRFAANDIGDLASQFHKLTGMSAEDLNRVVAAAQIRLQTRYSSSARLFDYRRLVQGLVP